MPHWEGTALQRVHMKGSQQCLWIILSTPCLTLLGLFLLLRGIKMDSFQCVKDTGEIMNAQSWGRLVISLRALEGWENLPRREGSLGPCWMPAGLWLLSPLQIWAGRSSKAPALIFPYLRVRDKTQRKINTSEGRQSWEEGRLLKTKGDCLDTSFLLASPFPSLSIFSEALFSD